MQVMGWGSVAWYFPGMLYTYTGTRYVTTTLYVYNKHVPQQRFSLQNDLELRKNNQLFKMRGNTCRQITAAVSPWVATRSISVHTRRRQDAGL